MKSLFILVKRNTKLFFKDPGMFFTSLITPLILLVLYSTFLGGIFEDTFVGLFPEGFQVPEKLTKGFVGAQLISSLLAVSCVTVSFCSNMLMVQDKANGSIKDLTITPVSGSTLALGYYIATLISSLLICFIACSISLVYVWFMGWYLSVADVLFLFLDIFLLVMFGTALSSILGHFLSTQGQISAVGSIISSCYGFICGAYMPISSFSPALQKVISFLPGTYGTCLVRNHALNGIFREMEALGYPEEMMTPIRDGFDCNLYFFGEYVSIGKMFLIMTVTVLALVGIYVALQAISAKKAKK